MALSNKNPCDAKRSPEGLIRCRRNKRHLLHHSKYERQHLDSRAIPKQWWDATEEEIAAAKAEAESQVP